MLANPPDWNALYAHAEAQAGYVTTAQAAEAGYSPQLLQKYLANGRMTRVRHGIYRIVHFPGAEDEDLVVHWLWSGFEGVFSHETALVRHDLSDLLPRDVEMTVPTRWRSRRVRVPEGLRLYYADLSPDDRAWYGSVPITSAARSVNDAAAAGVSPEHIEQAVHQGLARGLFVEREIAVATEILRAWSGP